MAERFFCGFSFLGPGRRIFSRDFSRQIFLVSCRKKCPDKSSGKILQKIIQRKISDTCLGIVQMVFSEKASAIARMRQEMRQKCVKNASEMRQNGSLFYLEKRNVQNASEIRQNCVKNASKMRGTPLGENTLWTIPNVCRRAGPKCSTLFDKFRAAPICWSPLKTHRGLPKHMVSKMASSGDFQN